MIYCRYRTHGFPPVAGVRPNGALSFSVSELAWKMFTTGRVPGDVARHGPASIYEYLHRSAVIPAYLLMRHGGLEKSGLYEVLDRSEKVGVSYALGSAMAGLWASKVLSVHHLLHLDRYGPSHGVVTVGRRRPDYIGAGPGGWLVVEAKGRSNGVETGLRARLTAQKRAVECVSGSPPWLAVGSVAHFQSGALEVDAYDPDELDPGAEPIGLEVDVARFYRAYYLPFTVALAFGRTIEDGPEGIEAVELGFGQRIGLRSEILSLLAGEDVGAGEWQTTLGQLSNDIGRTVEGVMPDGSYVSVDWDAALGIGGYGGTE